MIEGWGWRNRSKVAAVAVPTFPTTCAQLSNYGAQCTPHTKHCTQTHHLCLCATLTHRCTGHTGHSGQQGAHKTQTHILPITLTTCTFAHLAQPLGWAKLIEHDVHSLWDKHGVHNHWEHGVSTVLCNPGEDSPTLRPTSGLIFKCCHVLVFKWPAIELLQYPTITYHALITKQHWFKFLIYWLNAGGQSVCLGELKSGSRGESWNHPRKRV